MFLVDFQYNVRRFEVCTEVKFSLSYPGYAESDSLNNAYQWKSLLDHQLTIKAILLAINAVQELDSVQKNHDMVEILAFWTGGR